MKKLAILLCLLWIGVIFYNTSASGVVSNQRSMIVLNKVRAIYHKAEPTHKAEPSVASKPQSKIAVVQASHIENLNIIIRKNAHAFEYIILAMLICNAFFINKFKGRGAIVYVLFMCLLYAVTDEFHQLFVPGRTSLVSDVMIDFTGAIIGLGLFYFLYYKIYLKYINKRKMIH